MELQWWRVEGSENQGSGLSGVWVQGLKCGGICKTTRAHCQGSHHRGVTIGEAGTQSGGGDEWWANTDLLEGELMDGRRHVANAACIEVVRVSGCRVCHEGAGFVMRERGQCTAPQPSRVVA